MISDVSNAMTVHCNGLSEVLTISLQRAMALAATSGKSANAGKLGAFYDFDLAFMRQSPASGPPRSPWVLPDPSDQRYL